MYTLAIIVYTLNQSSTQSQELASVFNPLWKLAIAPQRLGVANIPTLVSIVGMLALTSTKA
jgi:hypothetical protein